MPKSTRQSRVNLTLTESLVSELQQWADQSGHTVTSLCSWLVKRSLDVAKKSKEYEPTNPSTEPLDRVRQFFDDVADGKYYAEKDLATLAIELEVDAKYLIAYQNCFKKGGSKIGS